ncbi:MAG: OpgC domain-containing protein [Alphaproteobacteria bacterium]|nr:OpgC domain-containing protein [Alphaproteobacteria bacterium]
MTVGVTGGGRERDLRLDFFRGLALFSIFIDHVPDVVFGAFTIQFTGLYDAAEVFIFISGYTAGLVYGRVLQTEGALSATLRIYHRVWHLYVAHVFLFMMFMALVGHMAGPLVNPLYVEEFRATDFLRDPGTTVIMALVLRFQPAFMDILPLYIVLLAVLPFFMMGLRRWWPVALACSFALWFAVQLDDGLNLPAYPGARNTWFFNPLAWQFLFLFGAFLGWSRIIGRDGWLGLRPLLVIAVVVAALGFALRFNWTLHYFHDPIPALAAKSLWPALSKTDLSALRLINLLCMSLVVATVVRRGAPFLASRVVWPLVVCGRHSLHIFCLGILLSVIAHLILSEFGASAGLQVLVTLGGIVIMTAVAAIMEWFPGGRVMRHHQGRRAARGGEEA